MGRNPNGEDGSHWLRAVGKPSKMILDSLATYIAIGTARRRRMSWAVQWPIDSSLCCTGWRQGQADKYAAVSRLVSGSVAIRRRLCHWAWRKLNSHRATTWGKQPVADGLRNRKLIQSGIVSIMMLGRASLAGRGQHLMAMNPERSEALELRNTLQDVADRAGDGRQQTCLADNTKLDPEYVEIP